MTLPEAVEILETHNKWRRGAETPMTNPVKLGEAIDVVVKKLKNNLK